MIKNIIITLLSLTLLYHFIDRDNGSEKTSTDLSAEDVIRIFADQGSSKMSLSNDLEIENVDIFDLGQGEIGYRPNGGDYLYIGKAINIHNLKNITSRILSKKTHKIINKLDESIFINYPAKDQIASMYIYTDTSCQYCQKMHKNIDELNSLGIGVKYIPYPRGHKFNKPLKRSATYFVDHYCNHKNNDYLNHIFKNNIKTPSKKLCKKGLDMLNEAVQSGRDANLKGTPFWLLVGEYDIVQGNGYASIEKAKRVLNFVSKRNKN